MSQDPRQTGFWLRQTKVSLQRRGVRLVTTPGGLDGNICTAQIIPDQELQVIPTERRIAEREPEGAIVEPTAPDVVVAVEPGHDITVPTDGAVALTDAILEPDPSEMNDRRLGQAVILQAIQDKASYWFTSSYSKQDFEFWCAVGGLDPGQVRRKALQAVKQASKVMTASN